MHFFPDVVVFAGKVNGRITHNLHITVVYTDNLKFIVVEFVDSKASENSANKF